MRGLKHLILTIILVACTGMTFAQTSFGVPNLLKYDKQLFHFGFMIGYNQFDFTIDSKPDLAEYDKLRIVNTTAISGFNLGIVTNLRLGKYFDLRFIPGLSFSDRYVNYYEQYPDVDYLIETRMRGESVYMDLPLMLKFKSSRMMNNVRAYVLAGGQYSRDLISNAKKEARNSGEVVLKLKPDDFVGQVGIGFDFYCTYFKFSTELKMSFGFVNLLVPEDNVYAQSVSSLKSKNLQISFLFE